MKLTQQEKVYRSLRAKILDCSLEPGVRIQIGEICNKYGVSLGGAREALARLANDELLLVKPQRGFQVAPVSPKDVDDLTEFRVLIESDAVRLSIMNANMDWEENLVATYHRLTNTPLLDNDEISRDWVIAHNRFHDALTNRADNVWLLKTRQMLFDRSERYRAFVAQAKTEPRDIETEHQLIFDAAIARETDETIRLLSEHLRKTADMVMVALEDIEQSSSSVKEAL